MYNVGRNVSLSNCSFIRNKGRPGGGGLLIEFSYCIPGDPSCEHSSVSQIDSSHSSDSVYTIDGCRFMGNYGFSGYQGLRKLTNVGKHSFSFGFGGGASVIMNGNASRNSFTFRHCHFFNNVAHMGAGFYVSFHDNASNNTVNILESKLEGNEVEESDKNAFDIDGGGGGGKVIYDNGQNGKSRDNSVTIWASNFTNNRAIIGGGLWVETNLNKATAVMDSRVLVESCSFVNNSAFLGSGVYLSSGFRKVTVDVGFTDVNFILNSPLCSAGVKHVFLPCSGILYSISVPISLAGFNSFSNNSASAIELHESGMQLTIDTIVHFQWNTSPYGAAIALYDCSYMELDGNTVMVFRHNKALSSGGAIYASSCSGGSQPADASSECFVQYYYREIHPNKWNTSLTFYNNSDSATGNNSLYVVSLSACWWPPENHSFIYTNIHTPDNINRTFCWKPWHYELSCDQEVSSGPAFITLHEDSSSYNIHPGGAIQMPTVRDGKLKIITRVLVVCVDRGPASFAIERNKPCRKYNQNDLVLYFFNKTSTDSYHDNHTVHLTVKLNEADPGGMFQPSFDIKFKQCEFPLTFNNHQCQYMFDYFCCDGNCVSTERCGIYASVTPKPQYCIANSSNRGILVGHCPLSYNALPTLDPKHGIENITNLTECANGHHGSLCGDCQPHLGVPVNSLYYSCVDCAASRIPGALLFIVLQLIPVTLLMVLIVVFNINLTAGGLIGFVFYCQTISLDFPVWMYPTWLAYSHSNPHKVLETHSNLNRLATVPYRIFNLDFLTLYDPVHVLPVCIASHMDPMEVIVFSYFTPFYCLTALLILTVMLVGYERGVSCVVIVIRPFHKCLARLWSCLKISPSLIESIASVYILCFSPVAATSFKLLHFTTWQSLKERNKQGKAFFYDAEYDYFGFPHVLFGILAILLLIFFCILPATFLVLYPYKIFHKFLDRVKLRHQVLISFGDINTGSLCDGSKKTKDFRSFAGLYFYLRLAIMCFYFIPGQYSYEILYLETITSLVFGGVVMIFRPFKKTYVNFANFMVFALLGAMSGLCLAVNSETGRIINLGFLIHLPLVCVLVYMVHYARKKCSKSGGGCCLKKPVAYSNITDVTINGGTVYNATIPVESDRNTVYTTDVSAADDWPDRLENPDDYYDSDVGRPFAENEICLINSVSGRTGTYGINKVSDID